MHCNFVDVSRIMSAHLQAEANAQQKACYPEMLLIKLEGLKMQKCKVMVCLSRHAACDSFQPLATVCYRP